MGTIQDQRVYSHFTALAANRTQLALSRNSIWPRVSIGVLGDVRTIEALSYMAPVVAFTHSVCVIRFSHLTKERTFRRWRLDEKATTGASAEKHSSSTTRIKGRVSISVVCGCKDVSRQTRRCGIYSVRCNKCRLAGRIQLYDQANSLPSSDSEHVLERRTAPSSIRH